MVIDTNNNINPGGPANARGRTNGVNTTPEASTPAAATPKAPASAKDNVVLSPEAQNLNRLQAKISDMPDVDMERVAAIKKAIAEGKFEINADRIAENMLNQEKLLG